MSHALYRLGRLAARHPWRVLGAWLLASVLVIGGSTMFGRELEDSFAVPGLDSQLAVELLTAADASEAGLTAQVVLSPLDESATFFDSAEAQVALARVQAGAANLPNVLATSDPAGALAAGPEAAATSGTVSADGRVAVVRIQYPVIEDLSIDDLENLKEFGEEAQVGSPLQVEMGGDLFFSFEEPETGIGEMIGLVAAIVILLLAFGSLIAMGLPIGMALFGLALGVTSMPLITYLVDIPSWAPQMATMIGLGVGIDYALFLVTRHREHLARGMTVEESVGRAVATAGQAVIFAGGTVVIAILGLAVAGVPFMTAAGIATSVVVLIMVVASVTLLPAFLGLAGHRIDRFGLPRTKRAATGVAVSSRWQRWGEHVSANAWPYAIGVTVTLLALTAPVLSLRLGFPDEGTLPESRTERRAYDLVADGFGPGVNGPLVIAIDLAGDAGVVETLAAAVVADEGIAAIAPPVVNPEAGVATLVAFPLTAPQDDATLDTILRLRSEVFPTVLDESPAQAHVGGQTASFADIGDRVNERLPLFIAAVLALSFLLLMFVFRSILVPLKAALLNLLSIGAAYGVLVMVFQWGWGMSLIGLEATVPIVSFIPMFMFAILFGLSMDYEVFLLSRVRENYLMTKDNESSVIHGIASTARVITSAALIMISVFGGFVLGDDPVIKMMGLGLATAIFVDATIVRIILVPATMKLMGDANWWIPDWLDRLLPTIDIEGEAGLPMPEMEIPDEAADLGGLTEPTTEATLV
ncbi:MAG: MMPL family transporter [Actinomycetia bacterium]|nr:MMPL family transporter [Actinomycetes bacterium]MCP5032896.1 MMPL family transporter [Actinomycetes bacterium]